MMFLTVGTQFPFDRLVKSVDDAIERGDTQEQVFAQIGDSSYQPRNFKSVKALNKESFDRHFREASRIIGHAGMGTISLAMQHDKPLLVMPRRKRYGEVVNDHQVDIAEKFAQLGHVLVAHGPDELPEMLTRLRTFVPAPRAVDCSAVIDRIAAFLDEIAAAKETA